MQRKSFLAGLTGLFLSDEVSAEPMNINISIPGDGSALKGTVPVTVEANPLKNLQRVSLEVDGALLASDSTNPFTFSWDTTTVPDGAHTLTAKAFYKNRVSEASLQVKVANLVTPPPDPEPEPEPTGLRFALASTRDHNDGAPVGQSLGVKLMRTGDGVSPTISVSTAASWLNGLQSRGIEPLVDWNTSQMNSNMNEFPGNLQAIAAALGPGGTQAHSTLAPRWWEIGNEQLYKYAPKPGPEYADEYTAGWLRARNAIKAGNQNCKVMFSGVDTDNGGTTQYERIASLMYGVDPKIHEKVDAWLFHHYGPLTSTNTKVLGMLDAVEKRGAPTNIPIIITEDGIGSNGSGTLTSTHGWPAGSYETYDKAAASHRKKLADLLAHPRIGPRLIIWTIWVARDLAAVGAKTDAYYYMGAVKSDGSAKGAYTQFVKDTAAQYGG